MVFLLFSKIQLDTKKRDCTIAVPLYEALELPNI